MTRHDSRSNFKPRACRPRAARKSAPRALLGPLADLRYPGTFDYAASLDLDLSQPDSVRFEADVRRTACALDPRASRLPITRSISRSSAAIHLPHGRVGAARAVGSANPHFVPLVESTRR